MTMPKRSRLRRILKWTGVATCVVILVAWGISLRWHIRGTNSQYTISIGHGDLALMVNTVPNAGWTSSPWYIHHIERIGNLGFGLPGTRGMGVLRVGGPVYKGLGVPFWLLLLMVMIPIAICFWRDRGFPPGHCQQCGYNLTGNVSGICSECGEPCKAEASAT